MNLSEPKTRPLRKRRYRLLAILLGFGVAIILLLAANLLVGVFAGDRIRPRLFKLDPARDIALIPGIDVRCPVEAFFGGEDLGKGLAYEVRINNLGFRGPDTTRKPGPGVKRIVCMGDSSTFGWGVAYNSTYVHELENLLNLGRGHEENSISIHESEEPSSRFEALNLGIYSYTSHNGLIYLRDFGLSLEPSVVVIALGTNDSRSFGNRPHPFVHVPDSIAMPLDLKPDRGASLKTALLNAFVIPILESNLSFYIRYRIAVRMNARSKAPGKLTADNIEKIKSFLPPRVSVEEYGRNLNKMADLARSRSARVIFLSIGLMPEYQAKMREIAENRGAPLFVDEDVYKRHWNEALSGPQYAQERQWSETLFGDKLKLEPMQYFRLDSVHPSPLGHRLIAEDLAAAIKKIMGK